MENKDKIKDIEYKIKIKQLQFQLEKQGDKKSKIKKQLQILLYRREIELINKKIQLNK